MFKILSAQDFIIFEPDVFHSYEEATINFNDGTAIRGNTKITLDSPIKFKVNEDSKPDVWTDMMLKGVIFHSVFDDVSFMYVNVKNRLMMQLLEVIELGEISIFAEVSSKALPFSVFFNLGGSVALTPNNSGFSNNYDKEVFFDLYAKKENEEAINFTTVFKFKKVATNFFENCPQIVDRLKDKKYKIGDIIEMVYYYNDYCAVLD